MPEPRPPEGILIFLRSLAECPHGKGVVVRPSPTTQALFILCAVQGWVEEVVCDTLRIWKVTREGREVSADPEPEPTLNLPPLFFLRSFAQVIVAEC